MLYKPDDCRVHKIKTSVLYSQVKHVCFLQVHVFLALPSCWSPGPVYILFDHWRKLRIIYPE